MATYYVDPAATGSDNGTSWADAWTTLQKAVDGTGGTQPVASDTVLCRGAETISAQIDFDGNSGNTTSGRVKFIGVNSSGVEDGTRYVINANSAGIIGIYAGSNYIELRNIEIKNATNCVNFQYYTGWNFWLLVNCYAHSSTNGFIAGANTAAQTQYVNCLASNCSGSGFSGAGLFINCKGTSCQFGFGNGAANQRDSHYYGCIANSNTYGFRSSLDISFYSHCVAHNNSNTGFLNNGSAFISFTGCRATSNGVGFSLGGKELFHSCYMPSNGQSLANTTQFSGNYFEVELNAVNTNNFAGTDADGGYVDSVTGDFRIADDAALRRQEIDIDGKNKFYMSAGLIPHEAKAVSSVTTTGTQIYPFRQFVSDKFGAVLHPLRSN